MHALIHGNWKGTLSSQHGVSGKLDLAVAKDELGKVTLEMRTDQTVRAGTASDIAIEGDTLRWTQDFSGTVCKATATLRAATTLVPETMKGSMACERDEITFALQKTKG